jgi:hypothetical protein
MMGLEMEGLRNYPFELVPRLCPVDSAFQSRVSLIIPLFNRLQHYLKSQFGIKTRAIHVQLVPNISLEVFDLLVTDDTTSERFKAPGFSQYTYGPCLPSKREY